MIKKLVIAIGLFPGLLLPVAGSEETAQLRVSASVLPRAVLEVAAGALRFRGSGMDADPMIPAGENEMEIVVKVRIREGDSMGLAVVVPDDLVDPDTGHRIPADSIHWQVPGRDGRLAKGVPVMLSRWEKSGVWKIRVNFFLENRAEHVAGNYSQKIVFSLMRL